MSSKLVLALLVVFFKLTVEGLEITSIVYPQWNDSICLGMFVNFRSDINFEHNSSIVLSVRHQSLEDFFQNFTCRQNDDHKSGNCFVNSIFEGNYSLIFYFKDVNGLSYESKHWKQIYLEEAYGPVYIKLESVTKTSAFIKWFRPLQCKCHHFAFMYQFMSQECFDHKKGSCGGSGTWEVTECNQCSPTCNKQKGQSINMNSCQKELTNLKPYTRYTYRIKYSLDHMGIFSEWSNTLIFTTWSEASSLSPDIDCQSKSTGVDISWKKPLMESTMGNITHFNIYTDGAVFYDSVAARAGVDNYFKHLPTEKKMGISVTSCSNGGCSLQSLSSHCFKGPTKKEFILYIAVGCSVCIAIIVVAVVFVVFLRRTKPKQDVEEIILPRNV